MGEAARQLDWRAEESAPIFDVVAVPDLAHEAFVRKRHERWLGSIALGDVATTAPEQNDTVTIVDLLKEARAGDSQALSAVRLNAHTTVIETLLKTGNIMRISAQLNDRGNLEQHTHSYEAIHRNALQAAHNRSASSERRSAIEALNWQRTEAAIHAGHLEDHWFVVFSLPPENESVANLKKDGFFAHTMTAVMQATTLENNTVRTESAFVAGMPAVAEDATLSDAENNARVAQQAKQRYDIATIRALYAEWGIANATTMSTEDLLATPLLIPKETMPNGIANIVEQYDQLVGNTFFGLPQPKQNYATFANVCEQKTARYQQITDRVVHDLLDQSGSFKSPAQAVNKLYALAKKHALERAYRDTSIDATVFGGKAAPLIERARVAYQNGDQHMFAMLSTLAQEVAVTTACGGGSGVDKSLDKSGAEGELANGETNAENWKWKKGVCRVESCPTRPGNTDIGPCDVCRRCQGIFDKGIDPTKFKTRPKPAKESFALAA
ncbi:MAG: hypothetical protein ACQR33_06435 [Candidatus Saccharibacteria bacterium]